MNPKECMIHSVRFKAVLDTNVIYPVYIRDLLLWFAHYELFTPKWSENICLEWESVMLRKEVPPTVISKAKQKINLAFPDAMVQNYKGLIQHLDLPDPKDRHVLAAAIKANAHLIITHNLKDFPDSYLSTFDLKAILPDDFLTDIIDLNPDQASLAFRDMVMHKRNPDLDEYDVLNCLRKVNLHNTANYLHALL